MHEDMLSSYIANVQISISMANYYTCTSTWNYIQFVSDFNRLYLFLGDGGYINIDGQELYPKRGQLAVLPAGKMLTLRTLEGQTFNKYYCHFTSNVSAMNLFQLLEVPYCIDVKHSDEMADRFAQLMHHFREQSVTSMLRAKSIFQTVLCDYIESTGAVRMKSQPASLEKVNLILQYIDEHLAEQVTLEELAAIVHFHPNYFIPFFKSVTGSSPIQFMNIRRMEKAKQLILTEGLTITEIAEQIGSSIYQFSKNFKKYSGYSPTDFRQMVNEGNRVVLQK